MRRDRSTDSCPLIARYKSQTKFYAALHPLPRLAQKPFTRPHARVGTCLNAHGDEVVTAVALICARIVADDVLLSQVGSDLHECIVQILDRSRNINGASGLRGKLLHTSFCG